MARRLKSLFLFFIILEVLLILYLLIHNFGNDTYSCDSDIKTKVLLIGVDAADWYYMMPLLEKGNLPNIAKLMKSGSYGYLSTIATSNLTSGAPMQWTSMITGKSYLEHGIVDYYKFVPDENEYVGPLQSGMRRTKALWNILSENNITVGVTGWWAIWPAEPVNGFMVSSFVKYRMREHNVSLTKEKKLQLTYTGTVYANPYLEQTFPDSFYYELEHIINENELADDMTINALFPSISKEENRGVFYDVKWNYVANEIFSDTALYLLNEKELDFVAIIEHGLDVAFHRDPPSLLLDYYVYIDKKIGELLVSAGKNTVVVVVSEHGNFGVEDHSQTPIPGIIIVKGPGIKKNNLISNASILDIVPTILHIFDLQVSNDLRGTVLEDIFSDSEKEPEYVDFHTVYEPPRLNMDFYAFDNEILKRLDAIGYFESD